MNQSATVALLGLEVVSGFFSFFVTMNFQCILDEQKYSWDCAGSEPTAQHLTQSSVKLIYLMTEPVILKRKTLYISLCADYLVTCSDTAETALEGTRGLK